MFLDQIRGKKAIMETYNVLAKIFSVALQTIKESASPPKIRTFRGARNKTPRLHSIGPIINT